ncbi:unnamed protein product [Symbiodinium pilosum]|uniref:PLA2c domain-containing protein n=1 Tax=Symbiodinium pilosum TaxID=2952 RepID=A0A812YI29_SYMPI|nr:unnamed protein product [Symbiodinium pilosum]
MGQCTSVKAKGDKYRPLGEGLRAKVLPVYIGRCFQTTEDCLVLQVYKANLYMLKTDHMLMMMIIIIATAAAATTTDMVLFPLLLLDHHLHRGHLPGDGINVGLCASGGGARAMSFTTGVYRALNELKLLDQLDAISSVSGGTWCSSIFMFAKDFKGDAIDTAELLGRATTPSELTMEALRDNLVPIVSGITNADSSDFISAILKEYKGKEHEVWPKVMSEWLLRHFDGLESFEAYIAKEEDVKRIKEDNPQLEKKRFLTPRSDRPKNFIMNGCSLAPLKYNATTENVVSFQMCPDFTGSPFYPENKQVKYDMASIFPCKDFGLSGFRSMTRTMGGGFTETFAFGGPAPRDQTGGEKCVMGEPSTPFSLPYAVGISSWAAGGALNQVRALGNLVNIRKDYWPVTSEILPHRQEAIAYQLGDGGSLDNAGVLALLQRGARKVIWICSSWTDLKSSYDWAGATAETFNPQEAGVADQVFCTFGYDSSALGFFYSHNQVFERDQCFPLCQEIKAFKNQGKPAVVHKKLAVLPNSWWGITGGYEVDLLLIYLEKSREFEALLPQETQREIAKGDQGAFANYPIYKTTSQNEGDILGLTAQQSHLLAAQAEYSVKENEELFRKLLS